MRLVAAAPRPRRSGDAVPVELASRDGTPLHGLLWRARRPAAGLLIVHGLQSHAGWFEVSGTPDHLAAYGVTVFVPDRRGSGRSGGARGHTPSAAALLEDLDAARAELARVLAGQGAADAPIHALANCFGTRILLPYLASPAVAGSASAGGAGAIRSVVLTAPASAMSRAADYGLATRLRILLAAGEKRFATPLRDELFVSSGPFLEWIRADALSLREVTAGFLRATAQLTRWMKRAAKRLDVPVLAVLGRRDAMVVNARIRADFVANYHGPIELLELDAEHYVDFTGRQPQLAAAVLEWLRTRS